MRLLDDRSSNGVRRYALYSRDWYWIFACDRLSRFGAGGYDGFLVDAKYNTVVAYPSDGA